MKHGKMWARHQEGGSALCLSPDGLDIRAGHMLLRASELSLPSVPPPPNPGGLALPRPVHGEWEKLPLLTASGGAARVLLRRPSWDFRAQSTPLGLRLLVTEQREKSGLFYSYLQSWFHSE